MAVPLQRKPSDRFSNDSDPCVHRRGLQRGMLVDGFTVGRAAKQEGERSAQAVFGLIAGVEQTGEDSHIEHLRSVIKGSNLLIAPQVNE